MVKAVVTDICMRVLSRSFQWQWLEGEPNWNRTSTVHSTITVRVRSRECAHHSHRRSRVSCFEIMMTPCSRLGALSSIRCLQRSYTVALQPEHKTSMSVHQPPWRLPERQTDDPVLKVYNSLTRSKVSAQILHIEPNFYLQIRPNLYLGTGDTSNGTTAAPPSMMLRTWGMLGKTSSVRPCANYTATP
jgi:hypothetical protein